MGDEFVDVVLVNAVVAMIPLLWAALGEAISERAGVINVGIEGVMITGAFAAAGGLALTGSLWLGVLFGLASGLIQGAVLAFLYVRRGTDQIVTGIMYTLLMLGLTTTTYEKWLANPTNLSTFDKVEIPGLVEIPLVGPAFFDQSPLGYSAFALAGILFYVTRGTWFGLSATAVGERPEVAEASGISVHAVRWVSLIVGCSFVAAGGAVLVLDQAGSFVPGATNGLGYIALAVVILGRWNPLLVVAAAGLFGLTQALGAQFQTIDGLRDLPPELWLSLPYIVTIAAVALGRRAQYPGGVGLPYRGRLSR